MFSVVVRWIISRGNFGQNPKENWNSWRVDESVMITTSARQKQTPHLVWKNRGTLLWEYLLDLSISGGSMRDQSEKMTDEVDTRNDDCERQKKGERKKGKIQRKF